MIRRFVQLICALILFSCAATSPPQIKVSSRKTGDIESISMIDNYLDFYLNQSTKPFRCSLNPAILKTKTDSYFSLNFSSGSQMLPFHLEKTDSLILQLNDTKIYLPTLDVSRIGKKYTAYYRIESWDLIDIGHADRVQFYFLHADSVFTASFSRESIAKYQYFNAKFLLHSEEIPVPEPPVYKQPWGFLGGGAGSSNTFWLGIYTNFIHTGSGPGDYLAAGMGYASFEYMEWMRPPGPAPEPIPGGNVVPDWVEQNQSFTGSYSLNVMYGLTYPSPCGRWSLEAGICFYYYLADKRWQDGQLKYLDGDYLTTIESGQPYKGFAVGGFIQIAGFWFQLNSKNWTAGLSVPVPWW